MRVYLLSSAVEGDYDIETVLDAGFPYSSLAKAQAAAQTEYNDIVTANEGEGDEISWCAHIANLSTWTAECEDVGTYWRIRECELDG